jgi:hypothetical protein
MTFPPSAIAVVLFQYFVFPQRTLCACLTHPKNLKPTPFKNFAAAKKKYFFISFACLSADWRG